MSNQYPFFAATAFELAMLIFFTARFVNCFM
jgi:hypothetical protein